MADEYIFLDNISTYGNSWRVLVKVDRCYPRSDLNLYQVDYGYPKRVVSFDLIVFDDKDTRMIMWLLCQDVIKRFVNILKEENVYFGKNLVVTEGGMRIHSRYHIILLPSTIVYEYIVPTIDHTLKLKDVDDIGSDLIHGGGSPITSMTAS